MKTGLLIVFALIVGLVVGLGTAVWRTNASSGDNILVQIEMANSNCDTTKVELAEPHPKVVVDEQHYDFGTMDSHGTGRHDFIFTNNGDATLELEKGDTTCKCTVADLEKTEIAPGESGTVAIEWHVKEFMGSFTQSAAILTNDPSCPKITLTIKGNVRTATNFYPSELVFSNLSNDKETTGEIRVYGYLDKPLKVEGHKWLDSRTAKFFDVEFKEMGSAEIEKEKGAQSGYFVLVAIKPGLPLGPFQQTIRLKTNIESSETISIPIRGTVDSEIAIVGRGWDRDRGLLDFGTVDNHKAWRRTLMLVVRGVHRKEVKFKTVGIDPELLKVTFGNTTPINNGVVLQTPVTIEIPKGCRPISRLGSEQGPLGRITIETNHPKTPTLTIPVRFAVAG